MARAGINKTQVEIARNALLAKGEHPSIDAIRMELGNTGSKSTIHRYLKELEAEGEGPIDQEAFLSEPIKALISQLVRTLRTETNLSLEQQQDSYEQQLKVLTGQLVEAEAKLNETEQQLSQKTEQLAAAKDALNASQEQLASALQSLTQAAQAEQSHTALLQEKQSYIDSLEEKHAHNRQALTHYRDSVEQQRQQDLRNFEQQTQVLQTEVRELKETLSVKQIEISELNTTNVNLAANLHSETTKLEEATNTEQQLKTLLHDTHQKWETLKQQHDALLLSNSSMLSERLKLQDTITTLNAEKTRKDKQLATLETTNTQLNTELAVKSYLLDQLLAKSRLADEDTNVPRPS